MNRPLISQIIFSILITVFMMTNVTVKNVEAEQKLIVIDEGHGQRFLINNNGPLDLSILSSFLHEEGSQVVSNKSTISKDTLNGANALVISGPFVSFSQEEIQTILNFVSNGGRLCVMLHIGYPVAGLLKELQIFVSNGVVHERENLIEKKDIDFYVATAGNHTLVEGIKQFKVLGGWALMSEDANAKQIAKTSNKAWVDLNRNNVRDANEKPQSFNLAITGKLGSGEFVIFGDDAIFQNKFLTEGNRELGVNLAQWLLNTKPVELPERTFL